MNITFVGHRSLFNVGDLPERIKKAIVKNIGAEKNVVFYLGGYGEFDHLCAMVCRSIKENYPQCEMVFVTPYILGEKAKHDDGLKIYDSILYPPLERVPPRYAISKRNRWMMDESDLVIAYVNRTYGGAYQSLEYARRRKKRILNLAQEKKQSFP